MLNEEEEFDYENDESWYEDAMSALDSPSNNHDVIYSEEEIADLTELDKNIIRKRNNLLQNGYSYVEFKVGDYISEVISRSGVIHAVASNFLIAYKKDRHYAIISQQKSEDDEVENPVQLSCLIHTSKHLGCYQFVEFFHLEEELTEDQKTLNTININRKLQYKDKPSLEFYSSDNLQVNTDLIEKIDSYNPVIFEFLNEFLIVELPNATAEAYDQLIAETGN